MVEGFLSLHTFFSFRVFNRGEARDIAFGREVNRTSCRIAEICLAENCLRTAELPNSRLLFSRIFIFANVENSNLSVRFFFFGSMTIRPRYFTAPKVNLPNLL